MYMVKSILDRRGGEITLERYARTVYISILDDGIECDVQFNLQEIGELIKGLEEIVEEINDFNRKR